MPIYEAPAGGWQPGQVPSSLFPWGIPFNESPEEKEAKAAAAKSAADALALEKAKKDALPSMGQFSYSDSAINYPTYMRNLGENMAQQKFQTGVNQGLRLGNSVQGYMKALGNRNNERLGYMSSAGQQDLYAQKHQADELQRRNQLALEGYGLLTQRYNMNKGGGAGWSSVIGGSRSGSAAQPTASPSYIGMGGSGSRFASVGGWQGGTGTSSGELYFSGL